jgi:hypothetical protein
MAEHTEQSTTSSQHFCDHCGTENKKGDYACIRCGERLIEVTAEAGSPFGLVSCPRCGSANNTRGSYCWVCGSEIENAVRITPVPQSKPQGPPAARTYRPDLNPSSPTAPPTTTPQPNKPESGDQVDSGEPVEDFDDLRAQIAAAHEADALRRAEGPFGTQPGDEPNTSGVKNGEVPKEIKRWNWAAFLMPAVWGLFSGVPYTAVLFGAALLPPMAQLVVMVTASVFLGLKGNELAWRGKKWRSVQHFNAFQKQWTSWAVKLTIAVAAILVFYMMVQGGT